MEALRQRRIAGQAIVKQITQTARNICPPFSQTCHINSKIPQSFAQIIHQVLLLVAEQTLGPKAVFVARLLFMQTGGIPIELQFMPEPNGQLAGKV